MIVYDKIPIARLSRFPDYPISQFPDFPISRFPDFPISRFPNFPISPFPDFLVSRFPNFPVVRFPDFLVPWFPQPGPRSTSAPLPAEPLVGSAGRGAVVILENHIRAAALARIQESGNQEHAQ